MTTTFVVGASVTRSDIPVMCADLAERLRGTPGGACGHAGGASGANAACATTAGGAVVVCDVRLAPPDVVTVEALARLRMTARRFGWRLVVSGCCPDLLEVIVLLGLTDVLPQSSREPVEREEALGVEEVVDRRDPPG